MERLDSSQTVSTTTRPPDHQTTGRGRHRQTLGSGPPPQPAGDLAAPPRPSVPPHTSGRSASTEAVVRRDRARGRRRRRRGRSSYLAGPRARSSRIWTPTGGAGETKSTTSIRIWAANRDGPLLSAHAASRAVALPLHLVSSASAPLLASDPIDPSYKARSGTGTRMLLRPPRLPRLSPRRLRSESPMASTLALLRPSAPSPLAGASARSTATNVRVPFRSRVSARVSVGSAVAAGADTLFADYKPTTAFLFPGQGAQAVGMGKEALNVQAAAELFNKANDILGYDLLNLCIDGPKEKLNSTVISQPAIYVTSLAAVEVLRAREEGQSVIDSVDVTCGLSLGEYTALAFAGAFSFEDGLKLVKLRGEAMQDASDAANSAMVSVIGLDSEKVQQLCDAANEDVDEKEKVQIANFLCPGNYAVSGGVKGIEAVEAKAKSFKARMTVRLAVAGAFHTSFMQPAVSRLESALAATEIRSPRIPVISNVDAQPHSDPDTIKKILAQQVTSPVQWETTVTTLLGKGLEKSYELGPGKVIAGIIKRINKGASIENIGA